MNKFIKWLIVTLAAGNLILLFIFDYQLPGFLSHLSPSSESAASEAVSEISGDESASNPALQIQVPSEPLIYDGSQKLDLMDDVIVTDASGTAQTNIQVFSSIKPGTSRKDKIIEYSATDKNGDRITAQRQLHLGDDYTGPTIEVQGDIPSIPEEELSSLIPLLISGNQIQTDDGFGKDVTSSITTDVKSEPDISGDTIITLTITNMVNDSYSTDIIVHTPLSGPVLRLTTDTVTLNIGENFSFYNYIAAAQDENGNDLHSRITVKGSVDTYTPGEYVLEIYCSDSKGNTSPVKTLTVTVK